MLKINKTPSKNNGLECTSYRKQIARLNKAIIDVDDECVRQSMKHEDEIQELKDECFYWCMKYEDSKAEIEQLKAESQNKKKVLGKVGGPRSNTDSRAPHSLYDTNKENDTKYGFAEDKDKHFDGTLTMGRRLRQVLNALSEVL